MAALWESAELCGLADNPAVPPHLMDVFVARANGHLAYLLARQDDLSAGQVRVLVDRLADFGEDYAGSVVDGLLAHGRVAPADVSTTDLAVALVVAEHPSADPALVRELAGHPDPRIRLDLAESHAHLRTPPPGGISRAEPTCRSGPTNIWRGTRTSGTSWPATPRWESPFSTDWRRRRTGRRVAACCTTRRSR